MSFASCACCTVVLNQQQEQNMLHQNQSQDVPADHSKNKGESCTVVENGRVIVKPLQPAFNQTSDTQE